MTDFMSAYFFLTLAVILLGVGIATLFFSKNKIFKWIFLFDAFCWLFVGLYCFAHQDATQPFILYLGIFSFAMFVAMGFMPFMLHREPKNYIDPNSIEEWDRESMEDMEKQRDYYKRMRGE